MLGERRGDAIASPTRTRAPHHGSFTIRLRSALAAAVAVAFLAAPATAATLVADGTTCSLPSAIQAANNDADGNGCVATGTYGADTITLDYDVTLGGQFGVFLPAITSDVTIVAGTGTVVQRDLSFGCNSPRNLPEMFEMIRLFLVQSTGSLTLDGLTLRHGCVPSGSSTTPSRGGAILVDGGRLTLDGVTLVDNRAQDDGGQGLPAYGGAVAAIDGATLTIRDSTFTDNVAQGAAGTSNGIGGLAEGGAIYTESNALVELRGSTFSGNLAQGGEGDSAGSALGGAVALTSSTSGSAAGPIVDTVFENNVAQGGAWSSASGSGGGGATGGALALVATDVASIERSLLVGNRAVSGTGRPRPAVGGALATDAASSIGELLDCVVRDNQAIANEPGASAQGGGIANSGVITDWERGSVTGNVASGGVVWGGGLMNGGRVSLMQNVTVAGNRGTSGGLAAIIGRGGGIFNAGLVSSLRHVTVSGNQLDGDASANLLGGGLLTGGSSSDLTLDDTLLAGNHLILGGAPTAEDCAGGDGAGFTSQGHNLLLVSSPAAPCRLVAAGDLIGVDPHVAPVAANGCASPLADGSCPWTVLLPFDSPAVDAGTCDGGSVLDDGRGFPRPQDIGGVPNADDACDIGALELQPGDTSYVFADGFETGNLARWTSAATGG